MVTVETLTGIIATYLPEPHAGLLSGISFGAKASLSRDLQAALITTGTLHIVALSGMNISIVSGIVSGTLLRFVSRRITSLLTVLLIIGFVWFVGPSASVVRAAVMGIISLMAVVLGRSNWPIFTWLLAVGLMLLINFSWLTDLSFQLSAFATLGIILFGGSKSNSGSVAEVVPTYRRESPQYHGVGLTKYFRSFFRNFIADDLRVSLAAQAFTIPIIFLNFHRISLISPLPNILIGWTIGPLTILGWFAGIAGLLFDPLGQALAWVAWVPLQFVLWVILTTSRLPFASLSF